MVVEVDLPGGKEEGVGQFSGDAVEAVVQVGLQAVRVVDWVKACGTQ